MLHASQKRTERLGKRVMDRWFSGYKRQLLGGALGGGPGKCTQPSVPSYRKIIPPLEILTYLSFLIFFNITLKTFSLYFPIHFPI